MAAKINIDVPEQGVVEQFSKAQALKFFDEELRFYDRISGPIQETLQFGNSNLGQKQALLRVVTQRITSLRNAVETDQTATLDEYVKDARELRLIIGRGVIGKRLEYLIQNGHAQQARWLFVIFAGGDQDAWIEPFRAVALGSPASTAFADLTSASAARAASADALQQIENAKVELQAFIAEKTKLLDQLEDLYRKQLTIQEPAISWKNIASVKRIAWISWLFIFSALVITPIILFIEYWTIVSTAVSQLATPSGNFSLSGVAAISVPALLYAWLLKNVSRVFIQNLNLADDASHRRALAVTYLGLAENPKIQLVDAERAIILNALFRPIPPHGGDDGPPVGLMDMIRSKSS